MINFRIHRLYLGITEAHKQNAQLRIIGKTKFKIKRLLDIKFRFHTEGKKECE